MIKAKTIQWTDGFSRSAGRTMGQKLIDNLGSMPNACWLFCAPEKDMEDLVKGVYDVIGPCPLIGCTTDGEISSDGFSTDSAVLGAIATDQITFETVIAKNISRDSEQAGRELAAGFSESVRYVQLFSDGLTGDGSAILRGMASEFAGTIPVSGGTSGDSGKFVKTWQFLGDQVYTDAAVAIGFCGDFRLGTGVRSGWSRIGLPKKVTRADGNVLFELNGESALNVYERFLGKHAENLPAVGVEYPLGIVNKIDGADEDEQLLLRATMSVDRQEGSIRFAGEIPEGAMVYLTCGDKSSILDATGEAIAQALDDLGEDRQPSIVFFYSCMARKTLLGLRIKDEIERVCSQLQPDVPVLGFYTYGEYCRAGCEQPSQLHNETATLSVIAAS